MKTRLIVPALILMGLSVNGCKQDNAAILESGQDVAPGAATSSAPETSAETPAETTPAPAPEDTTTVDTRVGPGKNAPVQIMAGRTLSGSSVSETTGTLVALGVRIGNYHRTANGSLQLSLCVDGHCQEATTPLANSKDNDYLMFNLSTPVVLATGSNIEYRLTRSADASNRLAIWGYPAAADQQGMIDADGNPTTLVPKLSLRLRQ